MKLILFYLVISSLTLSSQTQLEMNTEMNKRLYASQDELDSIYHQILDDYQEDTLFVEKLKASQELWIKFRDSELEMKYPEIDKRLVYGSMYPMCRSRYLELLTKDRIETLIEWLRPSSKGEGCSGSIKYRDIEENNN